MLEAPYMPYKITSYTSLFGCFSNQNCFMREATVSLRLNLIYHKCVHMYTYMHLAQLACFVNSLICIFNNLICLVLKSISWLMTSTAQPGPGMRNRPGGT